MMNDERRHAGRAQDLGEGTKEFALRVVRLYSTLPRSAEAQVIGRQLLRSGTSVGAQYREAVRARSVAEFVSKMQGALQELDESVYWLELLSAADIMVPTRLSDLAAEAYELTAIFVASVKTAKARMRKPPL
jgi:four helix bundle protein